MSAINPHSNRERSRSSSWVNLVRRPVAADDDLLLRVVQRVESVKELVLSGLFARDELDVVDEQHVQRPISFAKIDDPVVADGVDHLVHESLGRDVSERPVSIVPEDVLTDRMHQMRLAQSDATVDEQRVVRAGRCFGDRPAGRVGELIRRSDDERVE